MKSWKTIIIILIISLVLLLIGNSQNDVMEIQNNGASMCLACIGLE